MDIGAIIEVVASLILLVVLAVPLGKYMARIYQGEVPRYMAWLKPLENLISKILGKNYQTSQSWKSYALALMLFQFVGIALLVLLQLFQNVLPMNTEGLGPVPFWLSVNTAVSFVTNTNWQAYSGESTMSMLTQMLGLGVQNFLSAATGMAVAIAVVRGLVSRGESTIGNFWSDVTRSVVYILLPIAFIIALVLVSQGVVQNFSANEHVTTLNGTEQVIPLGPAASQIAIKQVGTNGGGYFGVNSAHPFENPTPFSNWIEVISILVIGAAFPFTYGRMVKNKRHGWALFGVMSSIVVAGLCLSLWSELSTHNVPGMMEGKETRFGQTSTVIWSVFTTAASNGSVNGMHDSMSPLSGMVELFNMQIGEIAFGGVGSGMYGMVLFVVLTVFIAGLMVGRTPEYLGKKIEAYEVKMAVIAVLAPSVMILLWSALASVVPSALSSVYNKGPHGFSEILYTFTSAAANNGSAFGGYGSNTDVVNIGTSLCMFIGRYAVIIPILAISGSMSVKRIAPQSSGTFRTDSPLFIVLLLGTILIVGALTFLPALSLGPIVEHLLLGTGRIF